METEQKQEILSWINETFKDRNFNTIDVEFPDEDTSGGALGDVIFVNVIGRSNEREQTFKILIKRSKSDSVALDDMNLREGYMNEINIYSTILPFFRKFAEKRNSPPFENIPKCFGTINKDNLYVVLMENLRPKGFSMHQLEKPHNMACAKLVLEAYATWQALCLAVKDQEPEIFRIFAENNKDFLRKKLIKLFTASAKKELDYVIELYSKRNENVMVERIEGYKRNFEENFVEASSIENCRYAVIKHGDSWNNNFLFRYEPNIADPKEVIIVDWQNSFLGPPLMDITNYLLFCCSTALYENIEGILKFYHDTLSTRLRALGSDPEQCFPWRECMANFKKCLPQAIFTKPIFVRTRLATTFNTSFDITESTKNGDCHAIFSDELRDPDEYFKTIDDTFKIFMEKGLI